MMFRIGRRYDANILSDNNAHKEVTMRDFRLSALVLALTLVFCSQLAAQQATNQSAVGQGACANNRTYWYQAFKYADGTLCTKFSFTQFFSFPLLWDPKWNADARKRYC